MRSSSLGWGSEAGDGGAGAFTHTRLYEGVVYTPLIVKLPGQAEGARIDALTQNIDVVPTPLVATNARPVWTPRDGAPRRSRS